MALSPRSPGSSLARRERAASTAAAARRRADQGLEVLKRLVPLSQKLSRIVLAYVVVVGVASLTIVGVVVWRAWPDSLADLLALLVGCAFLLGPVLMLWLFHRALAEVLEVPARLVAMPDVAREHGTELASLVRDAQVRRGRLRITSLPGDLWRAGRLLLAAHDDLPGYGAVLALVSVPFLLASLAAAALGLALIVMAPVVLVGGVLTAAF